MHLQEEPYLIYKTSNDGEVFEGNDRFEGYCKDLMDLIAAKRNLKCKPPLPSR